jgi:hypothetical protein
MMHLERTGRRTWICIAVIGLFVVVWKLLGW